MRWDFRNSWLVVLLNVLGALIAIGGVLGKLYGNTAFMGPLLTPVPLWVLLAAVFLAPTLTLFAAKRIIRPTDGDNQAAFDRTRAQLEGQVRDCASRLDSAQARLEEYES